MISGELTPGSEAITEPFSKEANRKSVVFKCAWRGILLRAHEFDEAVDFAVRQGAQDRRLYQIPDYLGMLILSLCVARRIEKDFHFGFLGPEQVLRADQSIAS